MRARLATFFLAAFLVAFFAVFLATFLAALLRGLLDSLLGGLLGRLLGGLLRGLLGSLLRRLLHGLLCNLLRDLLLRDLLGGLLGGLADGLLGGSLLHGFLGRLLGGFLGSFLNSHGMALLVSGLALGHAQTTTTGSRESDPPPTAGAHGKPVRIGSGFAPAMPGVMRETCRRRRRCHRHPVRGKRKPGTGSVAGSAMRSWSIGCNSLVFRRGDEACFHRTGFSRNPDPDGRSDCASRCCLEGTHSLLQ